MPEATIEPHKVLSPLPKRLHPPSKKEETIIETKEEEEETQIYDIGTPVFAKWVEKTDVRFWPGKIKEIDKEKYLILFDDGFEKSMKIEDFIKADSLLPGNEVNVITDHAIYQVGIILSYPDCSQSPKDIYYTVQLETSQPNLPETEAEPQSYKKCNLSLDQMKNILKEKGESSASKKNNNMANVSLDNLITSKRKSKPITPVKTPARTTKKGGSAIETSVHEDEEDNITPTNRRSKLQRKTRTTNNKAAVVDTSTTEDEAVKKSTGTRKRGRPKKQTTNVNVFEGFLFLLTQGKNDPKEHEANSLESETETEEDNPDDIKPLTFNRQTLKKMIIDHGGQVLDKFPGDKEKIPPNVILISDRYWRTMTYLLAITYGYDRINFAWIHNCVAAKKLLPRQNYSLQIGFSKILNK